MSPETLTHIVYVILVVAFVSVISYMIVYNLRAKARQNSLQAGGKPFASHEAAIMATQISESAEFRKHHPQG